MTARSAVARPAAWLLAAAAALVAPPARAAPDRGAFEPAPPPSEAPEIAPGVRIWRAVPEAEAERRRLRLERWRRTYDAELAAARVAAGELFAELERSSLAVLGDRCRRLLAALGGIDRTVLFPSPDVAVDRVLFGSLERFRSGAAKCLQERYLASYRLLVEARAGLEWVDRRLEAALRPRRLRGLEE